MAFPEPDAEVTPGWQFVSIGFEGDPVDVGGVDAWKVEWESTGWRITVAHPSYPWERHTMFTYVVKGSTPPIEFAAGEFSNGVWGFFRPRRDPGSGAG